MRQIVVKETETTMHVYEQKHSGDLVLLRRYQEDGGSWTEYNEFNKGEMTKSGLYQAEAIVEIQLLARDLELKTKWEKA